MEPEPAVQPKVPACLDVPLPALQTEIFQHIYDVMSGRRNLRLDVLKQDGRPSGWLYTWSLAIPATSSHKQAAWDFVAWMTSKSYIATVGSKLASWETWTTRRGTPTTSIAKKATRSTR